MMRHESNPDSGFINPCPSHRKREGGYALLFVLLTLGVVGTIVLNFQLGKIRNTRYETYFALGQDFALLARASHVYVQDFAYYNPYIEDASSPYAKKNLDYFKSFLPTRIAAFRSPLGTASGGVFTMSELHTSPAGSYDGFVDQGFSLAQPIRNVKYDFYGYGGLLPLRTTKELQASSALVVLYGRPSSGKDIRTPADMAAFRAGAASNGLTRIGIVLPPTQSATLPACNGQRPVVMWGNTSADCLNSNDVAAIGLNLDVNDIVAPAWEAAEQHQVANVIYSRPQPNQQNTNIMYTDLRMNGSPGGAAGLTAHRIADADEIFADSVNVIDPDVAGKELNVGPLPVAGAPTPAPVSDAMLIVGRANNKIYFGSYPSVCPRDTAGACFQQDVDIDGNMAVAYRKDGDPKAPIETAPEIIMKVDGGVNIKKGSLTINANNEPSHYDNPKRSFANKGFFDVKGGSGGATFKINGQGSGGNGTVINETVKVNKYTLKDDAGNATFIVDKNFTINGGKITIGSDAQPAQVIFKSAPLQSAGGALAIDTTSKSDNGVYSADLDAGKFNQEDATQNIVLKNVEFASGTGNVVNIKGSVTIDPKDAHPKVACVGVACPDNIRSDDKPGAPL